MKNDAILFFIRENNYGWLSNFERADQECDGLIYPTNEHFYQSAKTVNRELKEWIRRAPHPYYAMIIGQNLRPAHRSTWSDDMREHTMKVGLMAKFSQNESLKALLLETGDRSIHEANPRDPFWGMNGRDMLGKLLMQVREELRKK